MIVSELLIGMVWAKLVVVGLLALCGLSFVAVRALPSRYAIYPYAMVMAISYAICFGLLAMKCDIAWSLGLMSVAAMAGALCLLEMVAVITHEVGSKVFGTS